MKKLSSLVLALLMVMLLGATTMVYAATTEGSDFPAAVTDELNVDITVDDAETLVEAGMAVADEVEDYTPLDGEESVYFDPFIDAQISFSDYLNVSYAIAAGGTDMFLFTLTEAKTIYVKNVVTSDNVMVAIGSVNYTTGQITLIGQFNPNSIQTAGLTAGNWALVVVGGEAGAYSLVANTRMPSNNSVLVGIDNDLNLAYWYDGNIYYNGEARVSDDMEWKRNETRYFSYSHTQAGYNAWTQTLHMGSYTEMTWAAVGGYEDDYVSIPVGFALHFQVDNAIWKDHHTYYFNNTGEITRTNNYYDFLGRYTPRNVGIEGTVTMDLRTGEMVQYNSTLNRWTSPLWGDEKFEWTVSRELFGNYKK